MLPLNAELHRLFEADFQQRDMHRRLPRLIAFCIVLAKLVRPKDGLVARTFWVGWTSVAIDTGDIVQGCIAEMIT